MAKRTKTDDSAFQALKDALKSGELGRCYLFYGEEDYLRTAYLERLRGKLLSGPAEEFNYHRFSPETLDWNAVADAVEAMPMMAERTVVELDDVDLYKEPEANREKLVSILGDIPDYCCLIFVYDAVPYAPDKRLKKLYAAMEQNVCAVCFARQSASELRAWIRRHAMADGKDIDAAACDYLSFLTGGSMTAMNSELMKLTAYASGKAITKQDIDAVVEPTLDAVTFDISNALVDGDFERALRKLRDLFKMQEEPVLILGAIAGQMRRLRCAKVLMENGKGSDELMKLCSIGDYPARLTMTAARKLSAPFCDRAVLECLETDRAMKSSGGDPQRLLELLLVRLSQEADR